MHVKSLRRAGILSAAVAGMALLPSGRAIAAPATWDGDTPTGTAGNATTWADVNNWSVNGTPDVLPGNGDDLTFGNGTVGVIDLGGNRTANSLGFNLGFTLGTAATTNVLTLTSGNVSVNTNVSATLNTVIAGANGLTLTGGGTLLLNNVASTFTGNVLVDGSTLSLVGNNGAAADPVALGPGAKLVTLQNGSTFVARTTVVNPTSANNKTFVVGAGTNTFQTDVNMSLDDPNQFRGTGNLVKTGNATLTLGGDANAAGNVFSGDITVNAGTLVVNRNANALGTTANGTTINPGATMDVQFALAAEPVTVSGTGVGSNGVLISSSAGGLAGPVTLANDVNLGGNGTLTLDGVVSDGVNAFNVTKVGTGTTVLTNAGNAWDGNTTIRGGAIRGAHGSTLPNVGNLVLDGGAFETTANYANTLGNGPGQVQLPNGVSGFSGGAAGNVNVSLNGGAQLVWGSTPFFSPTALMVGQTGSPGTMTLLNPIDLNGADRTFFSTSATNGGILGGVVGGSGGVIITGQAIATNAAAGITTFGAANTYSGTTTLTSGYLGIDADDKIPVGGPIVFNGGGLRVTGTGVPGFGTHSVTFTPGAGAGIQVADPAHTFTVSPSVTLSGAAGIFTKSGPGKVLLGAASNTVTQLNMNGGTLDLGAGELSLNNLGGSTIRGFANSTIDATGGGRLIISTGGGTNYGDNSVANGVTLTINAKVSGGAAGAGFELCCDDPGGTIVLTNPANDFDGNIIMNRAGAISAPGIGDQGVAGPLGKGTAIVFAAAGNNPTVGAKLIYTGPGESSNRILTLANVQNIIESNGGTAANPLRFTSNVSVTSTAAKTLTLQGTGFGELAGVIPNNTAATSITKTGTGTWKLSGANTFTGGVNVSQGNLVVTNSAALGTGTKTITLSNGTAGTPQLLLDGSAGDITLPNTFTYPTSVNTTANSGAFINVAGNNTIQGTINPTSGGGDTGIIVQGGTLTIAANVATPATGLGTRSLRLRGPGNGTLSGTITNGVGTSLVGLVQEGTGTWAITGNSNTFSGATSVTSGRLLANNTAGSATGASAVTVSGTGIFGGIGGITGTVTINPGGTLAPGASIESLAVGATTFGNTGTGTAPTLAIELAPVASPTGNAGVDNDLLAVTGALTLTNVDRLNLIPTASITGPTTYTIATFASATGAFDNVVIDGQDIDQSSNAGAPNYVLVTQNGSNIQVTVANLSPVPEPAALGLLGVAGATLLGRRRRSVR